LCYAPIATPSFLGLHLSSTAPPCFAKYIKMYLTNQVPLQQGFCTLNILCYICKGYDIFPPLDLTSFSSDTFLSSWKLSPAPPHLAKDTQSFTRWVPPLCYAPIATPSFLGLHLSSTAPPCFAKYIKMYLTNQVPLK